MRLHAVPCGRRIKKIGRSGATKLLMVVALVLIATLAPMTKAQAGNNIAGIATVPFGNGKYWVVTTNGQVSPRGGAAFHGDMASKSLNKPVVGMASTPSGNGYWLVASDGGIFSFGDAQFFGSTGNMRLNQPIVGMAAALNGYWLVASDGGIFAFGSAGFFGSTGSISLNKPIVGMAPTPSGNGYWLVASDGGVFSFGDAQFFGSTGGIRLNEPIVGIATTPSGKGYWLVASDGGIFAFGEATFLGSQLSSTVKTFGIVPDGVGGYQALREDGSVIHHASQPGSNQHSNNSENQPAGPPGNWKQVFADEFESNSLDESKWITCYPWAPDGCSIGTNEAEWYMRKNVTQSNGALNLTAKKENVNGWGHDWNYTSGMVASGPDLQRNLPPKFSFKYGYVEARVWLPKGKGLWPAMWLLPTERQWPPELDVFEVLGDDPTTVHMTNHWGTEENHHQSNGHYTGIDTSAGWHTIGMNWQPDSISWYIDGVQRRAPFTNAAAIPNMEMYVIMNLAVGGEGSWPGTPNASTQFPATMKVDWIRVWQK